MHIKNVTSEVSKGGKRKRSCGFSKIRLVKHVKKEKD
jgi:hypothetical protein